MVRTSRKKEKVNTKVSAIVEATKTADMYYNMTNEMLEEYILRRFRCSKHIAKEAVKKLRDERL